jgi:Secretion system C-terminal sorting domain/PKD-like domain
MKNLSFILFICIQALLPKTFNAQTVTLSGPSNVEVGISYSYTASISGLGSNATIVSYEFTAPWIGAAGSSYQGIIGSINGVNTNNTSIVTTSNATATIPIIWGDYYNSTNTDQVSVIVTYKIEGTTYTIKQVKNIRIYRVCPPYITGPASIQQCCNTPVTYTADACDGNVFTWTITGGTITSGAGTATITVIPSSSANIVLTCTARRSTGIVAYFRTSTFNVVRPQPVTSAIINAPKYFCKGTEYTLCVSQMCGMTSVKWVIPASLQVVSGQGTSCITVTPAPDAANGATGSISAQGVMSGGCEAKVSPLANFTIYSPETPPVPQGYITLELESGNLCVDPVYRVVWHTNQPYVNGYTSVSPGIILGVDQHGGHAGMPIRITVCNVNLCSGEKSCIVFMVDPPQPCEGGLVRPEGDDEIMAEHATMHERSNDELNSITESIEVYPNPSSGYTYIKSVAGVNGQAFLYDVTGKLMNTIRFDGSDKAVSLTEYPLPVGVYLLQIKAANEVVTRKVIVR